MTVIDWQQIDTVLLDMDGTLLDLHFDNHFWLEHLPQRYATIHGHDPDTIRAQLQQRLERERGTLNWYCLDYWCQQLDLDIPALKREIQHLIRIRPYVEEFLAQLKEGPQQVILVTNAHRHSLDIKLDNTGIDRWFDHIVVSHDFNAPKEQQAFWQQLQRQHPFDPEHCLLIDDTISVLQSAQQFGIRHLFQHTEFAGILHFDEIMPSTGIKPS
jgi:putative hydrolase of the HAD superfamily